MWATIARIVERWRIATCVVASASCGVLASTIGLDAGDVRWSSSTRLAVFAVVAFVGFVAAVIVVTGLLAIAEHKADREGRTTPELATATVVTTTARRELVTATRTANRD